MCDKSELDYDRHWWGYSVDLWLDSEEAQDIEDAFESGADGSQLAALALLKKGAAAPAIVVESLSLLMRFYADDIGDENNGCGVKITWHFTGVTGPIPFYKIESQGT